MITRNETLQLPEGDVQAQVDILEQNDLELLNRIYSSWRTLCDLAVQLNARKINLPDSLSECAFAYFFNCYRTNYGISGADHSSFDAYNPETHKRIQIKGSSVENDLTSFGPNSVWDELYFVDFYRNGDWDSTFDVYLIDNADIYNVKVNKNETFVDQQKQGRRPRFSIVKEIIKKKNIRPKYTCNISTGEKIQHYE